MEEIHPFNANVLFNVYLPIENFRFGIWKLAEECDWNCEISETQTKFEFEKISSFEKKTLSSF